MRVFVSILSYQTFVDAISAGFGQEIKDKIIALLEADAYNSGLLVSHMAKADTQETANIYSGIVGNGDLADGSAKNAIVQGAVWDYQSIEDMLENDDSFVANFSD